MESGSTVPKHYTLAQLDQAASALHAGGVLAYPTEAVFGLGCDPHNRQAFERIFALKQRPATQGVLLIAADFADVERYVDLPKVPRGVLAQVQASWPGPFTWIFPRSAEVPEWVAGAHAGIALRVSAHAPAIALCRAFGGALVSTSANPHGQPPARDLATLDEYFGAALDGAVDAPLGGASQPTTIRDALTGAIIRT
ncbi:L-threonylcarbamoyladenylate synthase [Dyella mobilis]|uniref:Threonylcarbamoyl-AMP synthase n=1 Tax=Dyella mobilis TaxID=1849582 RepID=A0ABS2KE11_9GAMM|nr:L-threonylcarbamoyladenylate synthase [Dyella mobilis]MBM7129423.1 L-threonylcarbamoyladenylate synthase [Dyella mobilis]GLQ98312.1 threonylcarbamoyl-AMP synthase [Dyella mobilis]